MPTYCIEHLKTNPGHAPGKIIKAGTKIADAGLTGKLDASGHLMHICKASESGRKIKDFNRGGNASYANATMQDPGDIVSKFKSSVYGTWGGGNDGYKQSDGSIYVAPKVHLGGDYKFNSGTAITFKSDIKIIECGDASDNPDFGNCIAFEFVSSSSSTSPSSSSKTFKAVREGKSQDNGTYYFDEKYYADFKDGTQANSAVDTKGNTWAATTTWTKVYAPEGSSSSNKTVKGYSFKKCSANNGSSFFPIEEYGSTQDDLCFNIENLKKLSTGAYDLIKAQHSYAVHTQFKEIKTTFYK